MRKDTRFPSCTVQLYNGSFCDEPSHEDVPFPICGRHAAQLWKHVNDMMKVVVTQRQINGTPLEANLTERRSVVYYILVDNVIKIGTTVNLAHRLHCYPPPRKLLAIERGGKQLEAKRHKQFAALLAGGREWFRPDVELVEHINVLRNEQHAPPLTLTAA